MPPINHSQVHKWLIVDLCIGLYIEEEVYIRDLQYQGRRPCKSRIYRPTIIIFRLVSWAAGRGDASARSCSSYIVRTVDRGCYKDGSVAITVILKILSVFQFSTSLSSSANHDGVIGRPDANRSTELMGLESIDEFEYVLSLSTRVQCWRNAGYAAIVLQPHPVERACPMPTAYQRC